MSPFIMPASIFTPATASGDQFFLTFPFAPSIGDKQGGNYIARYLFDAFGQLKEARIFDEHAEGLRTRTATDEFATRLIDGLGKVRFGNIKVTPFSVEKFGQTFGLVFDPGEDSDEDEDEPSVWVTAEPGNYMAFFPPWDGDYDT